MSEETVKYDMRKRDNERERERERERGQVRKTRRLIIQKPKPEIPGQISKESHADSPEKNFFRHT